MLAFGATLNHWTTRHGTLIGPEARLDPGRRRPRRASARTARATLGIVGDAARDRRGARRRARRPRRRPAGRPHPRAARGRCAPAPLARRAVRGRRHADGTRGTSTRARCRSRSTGCCRAERTVAVDSGALHRLAGDVPRRPRRRRVGVLRTASRPSGSASAARSAPRWRAPDRVTVAALGDGGALMALRGARDRRAPRPAAARARLRRRGLRRRGAPLRARWATPIDIVALPRRRPRGDRPRGRRRRASRSARSTTSRAVERWVAAPDGPLLVDAKVDPEHLRRLARGRLPRRLTADPDRSRMSSTAVAALLAALADGAVKVVDLTQPLSEDTPVIQLPEPFANTPPLSPPRAQPLRRQRPGVGVERARDRRAHRHALRRADPLDQRQGRRGRRLGAGRAARRPGGRDRQVRRGRPRTPATC